MREILFRGKRIDNGEWVVGGCYASDGGKRYIITYGVVIHECPGDGPDIYDDFSTIEIDPETVGQYTGLTDKNGKKIFEGDIVKVAGLYPDRDGEKRIWRQSRVGDVFYYHGAFYFYKWLLCKISEKCIEIIGNIHDNPELLDKSELLEDKP